MPANSKWIVLSYPSDLSRWGRMQLERPAFRAYLSKTLSDVERGQVITEFVDVGCCGDTLDIDLVVEEIDGSGLVGDGTKIEFVERAERGVEGGWRVQSAGGPTAGW